METPPRKNPAEKSTTKRPSSAAESPQSRDTFPRRTDPPGKAGLANETRPGLGSRGAEASPGNAGDAKRPDPEQEIDDVSKRQRSSSEPNDKPLPREPQEKNSDPWADDAERDTGASGHLGIS